MLNDVFSLLVALWAIKLSRQKSTSSYTYGWQRAEVLGALVNGVFLLALCLSIFLEAIQRFFEPQVISNPVLVLIVGSCGLASNLVGIALFHDHGHAHGAPAEHEHVHGDAETGQAGHEHGHTHGHEHGHTHADHHRRRSEILDEQGPIEEILPEAVVARTVAESMQRPPRAHGTGTPPPSAGHGKAGVPPSPFTMARMSGRKRPISMSGHSSHHHAQPQNTTKQGGSHDLNMRGVFLHVMGDALGNIGVIATALFIWKTDFWWRYYFDPVVSLFITGIIFSSALPLVKSASKILLQAVPKGISLDQVKEDILSIKGVVSVHELHIWQLSDVKMIASLHIQVAFDPEEDEGGTDGGRYMKLAREIRKCLHAYGIHSSTIQPEYVKPDGSRSGGPNGSSHEDVVRDGEDGNVESSATSVSDASSGSECLLECGDECVGGKCCGPMVVSHGHGHSH